MKMATMSIMVVMVMGMVRLKPACVDDNGCTGKVCFDGHVDDEYEDARWSQ